MGRRRHGLSFRKQRKKFNLPLFKEILLWIGEMAIVIVLAYTLVHFFGFRINVVGNAMSPTLNSEEQIFVDRFFILITGPKAGDLVVFQPNGNEKSHYYVRRVIGCPGDTVQIKDGAVYVNGTLYEEETEVASIVDAGLAAEEIVLSHNEYFLLGDNRNNSEDSRMANIGNVKKEHMIGKAWFYYTAWNHMGLIK